MYDIRYVSNAVNLTRDGYGARAGVIDTENGSKFDSLSLSGQSERKKMYGVYTTSERTRNTLAYMQKQ